MVKAVRIVVDHLGGPVSITDAETGAVIQRVVHVAIDMTAGEPVIATMTVVPTIDIVAEAEFRTMEIDVTSHDEACRADH